MGYAAYLSQEVGIATNWQLNSNTKSYRNKPGERASGFKAVENKTWDSTAGPQIWDNKLKRYRQLGAAEFNGTYRLERKTPNYNIKILDE